MGDELPSWLPKALETLENFLLPGISLCPPSRSPINPLETICSNGNYFQHGLHYAGDEHRDTTADFKSLDRDLQVMSYLFIAQAVDPQRQLQSHSLLT